MIKRRCIAIPLNIFLLLVCLQVVGAQEDGSSGDNGNKVEEPEADTRPQLPRWESSNEGVEPFVPGRIHNMMIIQGTVITEDGSPPPFGTIIERDCGTDVTKEVLVDPTGFFSFIIGDDHRIGGLPVDASENFFDKSSQIIEEIPGRRNNSPSPKSMTFETELFGCVVRARYPGYRSTSANLGVENKGGLMDVGTVLIYRETRIKGNAVSITNLQAPDEAKKALKKGKKAFEKEIFGDAEYFYRRALELYPKYSEAWIELGWLYQSQKRFEDARKAYRKAMDTDASYVSPYIRLAQLASLEKNWEGSIDYSEKALSLDPVSYPQIYFLNGLACYHLDRLDAAEKNIRRGIKLDLIHQVPKMHLVLANILARKMDFKGSIDSMRTYIEIAPNAPDVDLIRSLIKEHEKNIRASRETGPAETK